jgi:hypothetical protein
VLCSLNHKLKPVVIKICPCQWQAGFQNKTQKCLEKSDFHNRTVGNLLKNSDRNFQFDWICVEYSIIKNQVIADYNRTLAFRIQISFCWETQNNSYY